MNSPNFPRMSDPPPTALSRDWLAEAEVLAESFAAAEPFPLVVLDDFLAPELAGQLLSEFPAIGEMPKSRDYVFGDKHELSSVERAGPAGRAFWELATSDYFAQLLSAVSRERLFVDPAFHGGGFHSGGDGSYLDLHVDFNVHPLHPTWLRRLNVLLYLNPEWHPDYGGDLLVKCHPDDEPRSVAPKFNRAVIMLTDERTFHGYRRMTLPDGVQRRSIATYAYREIEEGEVEARTTGWAPEDAGLAKRLLARNYAFLVKMKNRLFGSGTARNR